MKHTTYLDIIELVLSLTKSFEIDGIFDQYRTNGLITFFKPYFKIAAGELELAGSKINTGRDEELLEFNSALSDGEQLILAKCILIGYLTKDKNDILQMRLHLQDGDFMTHPEHQMLEAKTATLEILKREVRLNIAGIAGKIPIPEEISSSRLKAGDRHGF